VAQVQDAGAERACLNELEVELREERRKVRGAGAEDDRADELPIRVDQVELGKGGGEGGAAGGRLSADEEF
jgi:hypothetical protein